MSWEVLVQYKTHQSFVLAGWLGRSEGYIRTLRFHQIEPSVEALSVCSHKLGHYADRLRGSDKDAHKTWVQSFDGLKSLCDQAIAKQAHQIWQEPDRMRAWRLRRKWVLQLKKYCYGFFQASTYRSWVVILHPPSVHIRLSLWITERKCADWLT